MHEPRGTPFAVAGGTVVRQNISTNPISLPIAHMNSTEAVPVSVAAGHLSVHVEGAHPAEVPFLFEQQQKRLGPAFVVALIWHVAAAAFLLFAIKYTAQTRTIAAFLPDQANSNIIWLNQSGPGGGGGGGGNKMKEPPRKAELPGKDKITVPVAKPPKIEATQAKNEPPPIEQFNIPAKLRSEERRVGKESRSRT